MESQGHNSADNRLDYHSRDCDFIDGTGKDKTPLPEESSTLERPVEAFLYRLTFRGQKIENGELIRYPFTTPVPPCRIYQYSSARLRIFQNILSLFLPIWVSVRYSQLDTVCS